MSRIRMGWRLAKDSWAVLKADRSLAIFPLLSTLAAAAAFALFFVPGIIWSEVTDRDWIVVPFLLVGGYAATYLVVYFNVALAGAANLSMEGRDTSVSDGLAVSRQRRGLVAKWALVQFVVGVLVNFVESFFSEGSDARLAATVTSALASAAWSVASFFVIPLLALEGLGPGDALKRSVSLVRERWSEGLVGSAAIGLAVFLVGLLPVIFLFNAAAVGSEVDPILGGVLGVIAMLALIGTAALGSALGVIFRVGLYRYATQGQITGGFAQQDMVDAFSPRRRVSRGA